MSDPLELFWNAMLSRVPERARSAYATLDVEEKQAVLAHLQRMTSEPGWHPEQVRSAQAALEALQEINPDDKP
jgi:hypothetical protein